LSQTTSKTASTRSYDYYSYHYYMRRFSAQVGQSH
jgi:hypothetical protein